MGGAGRTVYRTYGGNGFHTFYTAGSPFTHHQEEPRQTTWWQRLLPIFVLVAYVLFSIFLNRASQPVYSSLQDSVVTHRTQQTDAYPVKRVEPYTSLPYFVSRNFDSNPSSIRRVEIDLLSSYYTNYQYLCVNEIQKERRVGVWMEYDA